MAFFLFLYLMYTDTISGIIIATIIRHYEMESEAKSIQIEVLKHGLKSDSKTISLHEYLKNIYDALLRVLKEDSL